MLIILLYVISFILETRSGDLASMNKGLEDYIQLRYANTSSDASSVFRYDQVKNMQQAFLFLQQQLDLLIVTYPELIPLHSYTYTVFNNSILTSKFRSTEWRFIQYYNIFLGARIIISYTSKSNVSKNLRYFLPSNITSDTFKQAEINFQTQAFIVDSASMDSIHVVSLELLFYNVNIETAAYYNYTYLNNPSQEFTTSYSKYLFLPELNNLNSLFGYQQVLVWCIRVLYIFYLLFLVFQLFQDYYAVMLILARNKIFSLKFLTLLKSGILVVNAIYFIQYLKLLFSPLLFNSQPIVTEAQFDQWIQISQQQKQLYFTCAILVILLTCQLIEMLQDKYYTILKIIYVSFLENLSILLTYFIMVTGIIISLSTVGVLVIVYYDRTLTDYSSTMERIVLSFFQSPQLNTPSLLGYELKYTFRGTYYFIMYMLFNVVIIQFILSILTSLYSQLKEKYEIAMLAAESMQHNTKVNMFKKVLNLLTFRSISTKLEENEIDRAKRHERINDLISQLIMDSDAQGIDLVHSGTTQSLNIFRDSQVLSMGQYRKAMKTFTGPEIKRVSKEKRRLEEKLKQERMKKNTVAYQKKSMKEILKSNLEEIGIGTVEGEDFLSRDMYLSKISLFKSLILKKRERIVMKRLKELSHRVGHKAIGFVVYLLYIYLFVDIVTRHTQVHEKFKSYKSFIATTSSEQFNNSYYQFPINFTSILTLSDMRAWVQYVPSKFLAADGTRTPRVLASKFDQILGINSVVSYQKKFLVDHIGKHDASTKVFSNYLYVINPYLFGFEYLNYYKSFQDFNLDSVVFHSS